MNRSAQRAKGVLDMEKKKLSIKKRAVKPSGTKALPRRRRRRMIAKPSKK